MSNTVFNLSDSTSLTAFASTHLRIDFKPITTAEELAAEISFSRSMTLANEAVVKFGDKLLYLDIARVVHLAHQVTGGSDAFKEAFNIACSNRGIAPPKDAKANPYARHVELLMSKQQDNGTWLLEGKWKNLLRVIRYLVENKVQPQDVPDTIAKTTAKDSDGNTLTRLLALNELDKQKHAPAKSSKPNVFGSKDNEEAIRALKPVATVEVPLESVNFTSEGYGLVVVRKTADGKVEMLYDAQLEGKFVMSAVRKGYAAAK